MKLKTLLLGAAAAFAFAPAAFAERGTDGEVKQTFPQAVSIMNPYPIRVIWPGLAISLTVLSVNYIGDGIRDALDPRIRGR